MVDKIYTDLITDCLNNGDEIKTRNSVVKRVFGRTVRFSTTPLVTVRKTSWKSALREWEWFMSGSNRIEDLHPSVRPWWEPFCVVDNNTLSYNYSQALRRVYNPKAAGDMDISPKQLDDGPLPVPRYPVLSVSSGSAKHLGYEGTNKHGDKFTVVDYIGDQKYKVQFRSNGFVCESYASNFLDGTVKNPYFPTVLGVACYGQVEKTAYTYYERAYGLWVDVLNRCYNPERDNYKWYGGAGVKVHPRWRCFEYFISDLSRLPGFEEWLLNPGRYHLDKDYNKADYYGPDVCVFLTQEFNKQLARSVEYEDKRPALYIDQIKNFVEGVKKHPYSRRNVITTWIPQHVESGLVNPTNCHNSFTQVGVGADGTLSLYTTQRSVDVICGLPHNWIQESAFLLWLCHLTNRQPGELVWTGVDIHVYEQHYDLAKRMVDAVDQCQPVPVLCYNSSSDDFKADDFSLLGDYKPVIEEKAVMVV